MLRYFWPSDDEQLAGQWNDSHFDEDGGWWANVQQCGATLALAVTLALSTASTAAATSVFSQSQDDPAGSLTLQALVQEDYWQNPVAPVNWPQPFVFTDDDIHVQFVESFQVDEDFWQNLVLPVQATNYLQLPFVETDQTPQFGAVNPITDDAASGWSPQIPPWEQNWTLLFFLDDGSTVPVFQYDEDFWVNPVAPQLWPTAGMPFQAGDDDSFVQVFSGNDEGVWGPQVPPDPGNILWPQPFIFEQNEQVANLVAFTDEIFWQNPTPPVPDSIWLLRQDQFDTQDPAGSLTLTLDDGFQPNFVVPDPGSLIWPQQWIFEQNEAAGSLYALHDEDFWFNPVLPVIWPQTSIFTFDEVIETFVQTFQPDEDFFQQLVLPVVAVNIYNQPFNLLGNQEDDVPVLSTPPPPPPPPICPLPPVGPDADTAMSFFAQGGPSSSAKPILALFCRICKSGRPLVVRADYAIWCQDCCAFVSKQDTYMGTVQAPGQFRSLF